MKQYIIEAAQVRKTYTIGKQKLEVLQGVTLSIPRAKISVIVGASGAGKSTLLHLLSGLDRPDDGVIEVDGVEINRMKDQELSSFRNSQAGFVFQFHHLLPEFTALENVAIPLMIGGKTKRTAQKKAAELLELVGIQQRGHHKPSELSGGEQQRAAIARALSNDPKIIFADEPTGNLDSVNSDSIHQLFLQLRDTLNKTFVIVTHNPLLMKMADNLFEIKDGTIKFDANPVNQ